MRSYIVEIYTVDWCGFFEGYEVMAEDEDEAEEKALELYEESFVDMYDLILTSEGYIESDDIDEDGKYDEDDCTTLGSKVVI